MNSYLYQTSAGLLTIYLKDNSIYEARFDDQKLSSNTYIQQTEYPLAFIGTPFQIKVWKAAQAIPAGQTVSYQDLATKIGHPKAYRAVASALARNKIAYFIPCHRILRKDGSLGGYRWGIEKKKLLLAAEKNG